MNSGQDFSRLYPPSPELDYDEIERLKHASCSATMPAKRFKFIGIDALLVDPFDCVVIRLLGKYDGELRAPYCGLNDSLLRCRLVPAGLNMVVARMLAVPLRRLDAVISVLGGGITILAFQMFAFNFYVQSKVRVIEVSLSSEFSRFLTGELH